MAGRKSTRGQRSGNWAAAPAQTRGNRSDDAPKTYAILRHMRLNFLSFQVKNEYRDEVEERGEDDCLARLQHPGRYHRLSVSVPMRLRLSLRVAMEICSLALIAGLGGYPSSASAEMCYWVDDGGDGFLYCSPDLPIQPIGGPTGTTTPTTTPTTGNTPTYVGPTPGSGPPRVAPPNPPLGAMKTFPNLLDRIERSVANLNASPLSGSNSYSVEIDAATGRTVGAFNNGSRLPARQGTTPNFAVLRLAGSDPVAASGEFVLDEVDVSIPGKGIPFTFARHYRSGMDHQSDIGFGWSHTFSQRIVAADRAFDTQISAPLEPARPDLYYITERLERLRLVFDASASTPTEDIYRATYPQHLVVRRVFPTPPAYSSGGWMLEDGSGLTQVFDDSRGHLIRVQDQAGHALEVHWSNDQLNYVVDTTGRSIYFHYHTGNLEPNQYQLGGSEPYRWLACLSLDKGECDPAKRERISQNRDRYRGPLLVAYDVRPIAALKSSQLDSAGNYLRNANLYGATIEFDLVRVTDSNGHTRSYNYYGSNRNWYVKAFPNFLPTNSSDAICSAVCKPPVELVISQHLTTRSIESLDGSCTALVAKECGGACAFDVAQSAELDCEYWCALECKGKHSSQPTYGVPPDLYHDLIEVYDGDDRLVLLNEYGTDPFHISFDKVVVQHRYGSVKQKTNFEYFDFSFSGGDARSQSNVAIPGPDSYLSVQICPKEGGGYGAPNQAFGRLALTQGLTSEDRMPAFASMASIDGRDAKLRYFDRAWRLIKDLDVASGLGVIYEHSGADLAGVQYASGSRLCVEHREDGRPTRLTELPAPGKAGTTRVTTLAYDSKGSLLEERHDDGDSSRRRGRRYVRDSVGRLLASAEQVSKAFARWTCFEYRDQDDAPSDMPLLIVGSLADGMFAPSGCALSWYSRSTKAAPGVAEVFPSRILKQDGTEVRLSSLSVAGPLEVVLDATSASPMALYYVADEWGRIRESGQRAISTGVAIPGSVRRYDTDRVGLLRSFDFPNPSNPAAFNHVDLEYDLSRHLTVIQTPVLRRELTVSGLGEVTREKEIPRPGSSNVQTRSTCRKFDDLGRLQREVSAGGNVREYVYDPASRLAEVWDGPGIAQGTSFGSWAAGCNPALVSRLAIRPGSTQPVRERVGAYEYGPDGLVSAMLADGVMLSLTYDGFGRVVDVGVPTESTWLFDTAPEGQKVAYPTTRRIHYSRGYDGPDIAWQAVSDGLGSPIEKPSAPTLGLHAMTEYSHDMVGRLTQTRLWHFAGSPPIKDAVRPYLLASATYDDSAASVAYTDSTGTSSFVRHDGIGRVVESRLGDPARESIGVNISYSDDGLLETRTLAPFPTATGQQVLSLRRLPTGFLTEVIEGNRTIAQRSPDALGRTATEWRLGREKKTYNYDAWGNVREVNLAFDTHHPTRNHFSWSRDDQLTSVVDGAGNTTALTYDAIGRLASVQDFSGKTTYSYLSATRRVGRVVSPASVLNLSYDLAGRQIGVDVVPAQDRAATPPRRYAYTALGQINRASVVDNLTIASVAFTYDSLGRLIEEGNNVTGIGTTFEYGDRTVTTSLKGQTGVLARYSRVWDALGRPSLLTYGSKPVASLVYVNGALKETRHAGTAPSIVRRDVLGRVDAVSVGTEGAPLVRKARQFGEDDTPRQHTLTLRGRLIEESVFKMDLGGRVTAEASHSSGPLWLNGAIDDAQIDAALGAAAVRYTLDGESNWLKRAGPDALSITVDRANRYTKINNKPVSYVAGGGLRAYDKLSLQWDGLGNLTAAASGPIKRRWVYDALGRRLAETNEAGRTKAFVWDGRDPIGVVRLGGALTGSVNIGFGDSAPLAQADIGASQPPRFLHHGPDGSIFAVTSSNSTVLETYSYSAFGRPRYFDDQGHARSASAFADLPLYQGRVYDAGTGMYAMGARDYKPDWGRFASPDPVGIAGGLNRFAYVGGRPLTYSDPSGFGAAEADPRLPGFVDSYEFLRVEDDLVTRIWRDEWSKAFQTSRSWPARLWAGTKAISLSPNAILEALGTGLANVFSGYYPLSSGELIGQSFARATLTSNDATRWDRYADASALTLARAIGLGLVAEGFTRAPGWTGDGANAAKGVGATGKFGENALKALGGESQVYFRTSQGGRYVDQLVNGIANESKVGYTSFTSTIRGQIAKDAELIQTGRIDGATWNFFTSPVTGKGGASQPLLDALRQNGIDYIIH